MINMKFSLGDVVKVTSNDVLNNKVEHSFWFANGEIGKIIQVDKSDYTYLLDFYGNVIIDINCEDERSTLWVHESNLELVEVDYEI